MPPVPYVVGQWVRGDRFYGRARQIREILEGPRDSLWLLGTRRIGKTSLLKQLEHLAETSPDRRYFPIFWDFQGAEESRELHLNFADALLDADERLERVGITLEDVEADDLFVSLGRLRRRLRASNLALLLLCDEVEELIKLHNRDASLLRKLRRVMQSGEGIRTVLASTIRLWALADEGGDTSPFLHGFTPPLYIARLSDREARSLIEQSHLDAGERPDLEAAVVETIRARCDNHPYLLQLVCKRFLEIGDVEEAIEQVATDRMVSYFFDVDFRMLSEAEHRVIEFVAGQSAAARDSIQEGVALGADALEGTLNRLENLGFLRRSEERRFVLSNYFFHRWLQGMRQHPSGSHEAAGEAVLRVRMSDQVTLERRPEPAVIDGRYELLDRVGEGATGIVYSANDRLLQTTIAIKVLRGEYAADEGAVDRFRQELVLARDIGHPNILRMYHLGVFEGHVYLTMQWVDGPTLAEVIRLDGPMPVETLLPIGRKLASALEAAHSRGVLHRDIKPQNVLLDRTGEPLVTDFGLARLLGEPGITRSGMFLGTPNYASPEQADLKPLDERSDVYALGLVLFELATGTTPFDADTVAGILAMHRESPAPDPREVAPGLSREFARLTLRCLEKDPAKRYRSAAALRRAIELLE